MQWLWFIIFVALTFVTHFCFSLTINDEPLTVNGQKTILPSTLNTAALGARDYARIVGFSLLLGLLAGLANRSGVLAIATIFLSFIPMGHSAYWGVMQSSNGPEAMQCIISMVSSMIVSMRGALSSSAAVGFGTTLKVFKTISFAASIGCAAAVIVATLLYRADCAKEDKRESDEKLLKWIAIGVGIAAFLAIIIFIVT